MGGAIRIASSEVTQPLFAPFLTAVKVPIHGAGSCLCLACGPVRGAESDAVGPGELPRSGRA